MAWLKVGSVLKKKNGEGSYIKIAEDVTLRKGQILQVQDPRKRPGITPEQLGKIPEFVRSELFLPPQQDKG